jgi:hypothetical protein
MELHRVIFRVDFPPAFELVNHWGEALALLNANKLWTQLGETANLRQIVAQHNDQGTGVSHNTVVALNYISGNIEQYPIKSLESFERVFRDVTGIVTLGGISSFLRIGARFVYLEEAKSFEVAKHCFARQIRGEYLEAFKGELTDLSLITVNKEGDNLRRINAGPIAKKEYAAWFSMPDKLGVENAFLADVDFYTFEYKFKTFDLRKFVDLAFTDARKQSVELMKLIKGEGR